MGFSNGMQSMQSQTFGQLGSKQAQTQHVQDKKCHKNYHWGMDSFEDFAATQISNGGSFSILLKQDFVSRH